MAHPRRPRPRIRPRTALLLLLGGCGGAPAEPAPFTPFDPLVAAASGTLDGRARALWRLDGGDPGDWRLASELGAAAEAEPEGRLTREGRGLVLRGPHIAAVLAVALESDESLGSDESWMRVSAELASLGRDGQESEGYARLGVLQVDADRLPDDLGALLPRIVAQHFDSPMREASATPRQVELAFELDPATRALVFVLESTDPAGLGAGAALSALEVVAQSPAAAAQSRAAEYLDPAPQGGWPADRPRYGRFDADLVHRHGLALPDRGRAVVPVESTTPGAPLDRAHLELHVAALGADHTGRWKFRVAWSSGAGDEQTLIELEREALADGDDATASIGWTPMVAQLPEDAGGEGALVLEVLAPEGAPGDAIGLFAGARLAPARLAPARRAPTDGAPTDGAPTRSASDRAGPAARRPNLLLVSIDTLRADHVGLLGEARALTPSIDALGARARVFEDAWSTAPYTLPAHLSLFSGQHPTVHGVQRPTQRRDRARSPMLAELLAAAGWRTAAFTGGAMVLPRFGFADGFERYGTLDPWIHLESSRTAGLLAGVPGFGPGALQRTGLDAIERQLEAFGDDPWFLFVHTYAAHEFDPPPEDLAALGYERGLAADHPDILRYLANQQPPPAPIRTRLEELYAGGVRHADRMLAGLLALLEERGETDHTLVVVTSDHGKEIGEHGMVGHGHVLFDELVRIPLLIAGPGIEAGRDPRPAQLVDLLPTLLARLGLDPPRATQGRDLLDPSWAGELNRALWAEVDATYRKRALRTGTRKTIRDLAADDALEFDLARDPAEQSPLEPRTEELAALDAMGAALESLAEALGDDRRGPSVLDDASRAHLEALGYLVERQAPDSGSAVED
jgi:arylsulfatase A-like enzyme